MCDIGNYVIRIICACVVSIILFGCFDTKEILDNNGTLTANDPYEERLHVFTLVYNHENKKLKDYLESHPNFPESSKGNNDLYEYAAISNNIDALKMLEDFYEIGCPQIMDALRAVFSAPKELDLMTSTRYLLKKKQGCITPDVLSGLIYHIFYGGNDQRIDELNSAHTLTCDHLNSTNVLVISLYNGVDFHWIEKMVNCGANLQHENLSSSFWDQVLDNYKTDDAREFIKHLRKKSDY